jgi:hypothetical protein
MRTWARFEVVLVVGWIHDDCRRNRLHESWPSGQSNVKVVLRKKRYPQTLPKQRCVSQNVYSREYKYKFPSFQGIS